MVRCIFRNLQLLFFLLPSIAVYCQTNETEPNDNPIQATQLILNDSGKGKIAASDIDWWKVKTTGDGRLDVQLENYSSAATLAIELFDSSGLNVLDSAVIYSNSGINMKTDGLGAGLYLIKIKGLQAMDEASYKLSNLLTEPLEANDPEPNNGPSEPKPITLLSTVTGHYGYASNGTTDKQDWYTFTTPEDGSIYFNFTNHSPDKVVLCQLLDTIYNISAEFAQPGSTNLIYFKGCKAGKYYIQISNDVKPSPSFGTYTLSYDSLITAAVPNDVEPNNHKRDALELPLNSVVTGHTSYYYSASFDTSDWYKIILPKDGLLKFYITSHADLNYSVLCSFFDHDGKTLLAKKTAYKTHTRSFSYDGLRKGTYYVKIDDGFKKGFTYDAYTLTDSFFTYKYSSDTNNEINRRPYMAKETPFNKKIEGHVGFYYNNHRDSVDWRKHTYHGYSGNFQLAFNLLPSLIDNSIKPLGLQLFLDTLSSPLLDTVINKDSNTIKMYNLPQGCYYLKVSCANPMDWNAYSFIATEIPPQHFTLQKTTNDLENNKAFDWKISENPIQSDSKVLLTLPDNADVAIQFINLTGVINTLYSGRLSKGKHTILLNTADLSEGIYTIKLIMNKKVYSEQVVKLKN